MAVSVPLGIHSWGEIKEERHTEIATEEAETRLKGTGLETTDVSADGRQVTTNVADPEKPPSVEPLADNLEKALNVPVRVRVQWTARVETSAETT